MFQGNDASSRWTATQQTRRKADPIVWMCSVQQQVKEWKSFCNNGTFCQRHRSRLCLLFIKLHSSRPRLVSIKLHSSSPRPLSITLFSSRSPLLSIKLYSSRPRLLSIKLHRSRPRLSIKLYNSKPRPLYQNIRLLDIVWWLARVTRGIISHIKHPPTHLSIQNITYPPNTPTYPAG